LVSDRCPGPQRDDALITRASLLDDADRRIGYLVEHVKDRRAELDRTHPVVVVQVGVLGGGTEPSLGDDPSEAVCRTLALPPSTGVDPVDARLFPEGGRP